MPIQKSLKAPGLSHLPSAHSETINKARHRLQRRAHRGIKLSTDTRDAEGRKPFRAADLVSGGAGRAFGDGFGLKALAEAVAKLPAPGWLKVCLGREVEGEDKQTVLSRLQHVGKHDAGRR